MSPFLESYAVMSITEKKKGYKSIKRKTRFHKTGLTQASSHEDSCPAGLGRGTLKQIEAELRK